MAWATSSARLSRARSLIVTRSRIRPAPMPPRQLTSASRLFTTGTAYGWCRRRLRSPCSSSSASRLGRGAAWLQARLMYRRDALRLLGALTLPRFAFADSPHNKIKSIGLQLYTVRAALEADFDGTLARVAAIGYREVEFAGYLGHSSRQVSES